MILILATLAIIVWSGFGLATWGTYCGAHRAAEYRWIQLNYSQLVCLTLLGPIGLSTVSAVDGLEHWSWYPPGKEECWQYWIEKGYGDSPKMRREFEDYQRGR